MKPTAASKPEPADMVPAAGQGNAGKRDVLLGLLLVVMTLIAYWPAIQDGGFIWDDDDYILNNYTLRDASGLKEIWTDPEATPQYYPLVHTGYWIEYQLWGLNPTGYHLSNVLLHALASLLLWRVLKMLTLPGAWLVAAFFAMHPVHVESVAWITERKNVLSGVFYLAAAWAYFKWAYVGQERRRSRLLYAGALLLFVCALLSKTVTCSLPAALLLVAWWKSDEASVRSWWARHLPPLLPFFVIGLGMALMTVWLEKHHVGADGAEWDLSLIERGLIAGRALWFYAANLVWPVDLCFNYTRWQINAAAWWQYLFPLSFAALLGVLWWKRVQWGRGLLVAALFFAGSLFPALGFIDVYPMRYSFVADHFQYLANISVLVLMVIGLLRLGQRFQGTKWHCLLPIALLPLFLVMSWRQCGIYRGLEELWVDTLEHNPDSFMSYNNLGQLRLKEGRFEEAIEWFQKCIEVKPDEVTAINNMAVSLANLGRIDEAEARYRQAMKTDPDDPQAYHNYGAMMAKVGRMQDAMQYYRKALDVDDGLAATHINLAVSLSGMGQLQEAIGHHQRALELEPHFAQGHLKFGETLQSHGLIRQAADQYRMALDKDPELAAAHNYLGLIAAGDQLLAAALDHFSQALQLMPGYAEAHRNMALVLASSGQVARAGEHYKRAAALAPNSVAIRLAYAQFLASQGDLTALEEAKQVLGLMPHDPDLLFQLGAIEQKLGEVSAAEARFRKVLAMDAKHEQATNHLAVLLAGQGNLTEAVELLRNAVRLSPNHAEYHNNLGVMLVRQGNRAEARQALEKAVELSPGYGEARKNLADLIQLMNPQAEP